MVHARYKQSQGFTLVELLVTISLVGILSAMSVPIMTEYRARAHDVSAKLQMRDIQLSYETFRADNPKIGNLDLRTISSRPGGSFSFSGFGDFLPRYSSASDLMNGFAQDLGAFTFMIIDEGAVGSIIGYHCEGSKYDNGIPHIFIRTNGGPIEIMSQSEASDIFPFNGGNAFCNVYFGLSP